VALLGRAVMQVLCVVGACFYPSTAKRWQAL